METKTLAEINNRMAVEMDSNLRRLEQEQQRRKTNQDYKDFKDGWRAGIIVEEQDIHGNHFVVDAVDRFNSVENARRAMLRNREPPRSMPTEPPKWKRLQENEGFVLWVFKNRGRITFGQKTIFVGSFDNANENFWDLF